MMKVNTAVEYVGKDLEAMDFAERYHRWIVDLMRPHLGADVVEVGAGTGSFSRLLLEEGPRRLTLVEPSEMFDSLRANLAGSANGARLTFFRDVFAGVAAQIRNEGPPDSVIYVNVLEHVEDDETELVMVHETLAEHGRVLIFVPALRFLYSEFDKQIGHHRRYGMRDLTRKCEAAGFRVLDARWFDLAGVAPWLIKYRIMRSRSMESGMVQTYDRIAVPVIKRLERLVRPPVGKNILMIARKI